MLLPGISWPGGSPENSGIILGVIFAAYLGAMWLAAIVWTARDIRERSRDPVTQAVATVIVVILNLPGWVLYLVLRPPLTLSEVYERQLEEEALLQDLTNQLACPACGAEAHEDYVVCPHCTAELKQPCRACDRALLFSWRACPWCATKREPVLPAAAAITTPDAAPSPPRPVTAPVPAQQPRTIVTAARGPLPATTQPPAKPSPFRPPDPPGSATQPTPPARPTPRRARAVSGGD